MTKQNASAKAHSVLRNVSYTIPVDVNAIAAYFDIDVRLVDLEDEISGMLVLKDDQAIIGVNVNHSITRQRFTTAHELGHYFLHKEPGKVFIDNNRVKF